MKLWTIAIVLFAYALGLRLWNINNMGRWSDEAALVDKGYALIELIKNKDFNNQYWYNQAAGHPLLTSYFYGLASYKDFIKYDKNKKLDTYFSTRKGGPVFQYDLTYSRLISVIVSSLSVILIFFIGVRYFSLFTGVTAALILATLPHFLGYSQLVTYESFVVPFFTACTFLYYLYLEKQKYIFLVFTGILTGMTLQVKESTGIIFALYLATFLIWKKITNKNLSFIHLITIAILAIVTYFLLWPSLFIHLREYFTFVNDLWFNFDDLVPELLFGRRMGARSFYYPIALIITTPLLILVLTAFGLKDSVAKRKNWIYPALIIWFLTPFLMMLFHHRQNMVRYIIEIYAPLSLLAALGLQYCIKLFTKNKIILYSSIIPVLAYLFYILISLSPYYLAYYNELVGGTKNVYDKKLFYIGWFGEGLRNPGIYIAKNAQKNSSIGLATDPYSLPAVYTTPSLKYEPFNPLHKYDYVMLSYYKVIRMEFNENTLKKDYKLVFAEKAGSIDFVRVYKHK